VPLVRVAALRPVVTFIRAVGVPVEPVLERAHLPAFVFYDPEALIALAQVSRFMRETAAATGIADVGLVAGRALTLEALGTFGRLVCRTQTVGDALEAAIRWMPAFNSGVRWRLVRGGDRARLCQVALYGADEKTRQTSQYTLMIGLGVLRLAAAHWQAGDVVVETSTARGFLDGRLVADTTVRFDRPDAISFPQSLLSQGIRESRTSGDVEIDQDVDAWQAWASARDFPGSVLRLVETLSAQQYPRIGLTAVALGMSVRALQRRLAEAGMSYGRLVAQARFASAVDLLAGTDASVLDIALDLGYSDHAHFTRAFRRWTGVAPRDYRRSHEPPLRVSRARRRRPPAGWMQPRRFRGP
jgi:AraC-like DNA-binding protein